MPEMMFHVLPHVCLEDEPHCYSSAVISGSTKLLHLLQIPALMGMLQSGERGQQEAAVAALASLADGNALVSAAVAAVSGSVTALQGLLRDRDPGIRLLAAACLVQLLRYEHVAMSNQVGSWALSTASSTSINSLYHLKASNRVTYHLGAVLKAGLCACTSRNLGPENAMQTVPRAVLAALVRALQEQGASPDEEALQQEAALLVPQLLAVLLTARPELQPLAADTNAVTDLCQQYIAQSPVQAHQKARTQSCSSRHPAHSCSLLRQLPDLRSHWRMRQHVKE
jgi:hypothetical protein